jgi:hypothetical protein
VIRRNGPQEWKNIHVTKTATLHDLIDIDNSVSGGGTQPSGFDLLKQAAGDLGRIVKEARQQEMRIRALGSAWALTDIAVTNGWLINTKLLNGCFDVSDHFFESIYPQALRPYLVVAQCGISVGQLNVHLEMTATVGFRRALKTSGIGCGQTIAGAISGNTHGAAINFGATPDFVVGLQIVTGDGQSLWIERASHPVLNDDFVSQLDAHRIRDDEVFDAAIVSFGAFGIITAVAIETDPIYQLDFPPVSDITHKALQHKLENFDFDYPVSLYHYEFVFNPYSRTQRAMEATGTRVDFEPGHPAPDPLWVVRDKNGFAPGDKTAPLLLATGDKATPMYLGLRFLPAKYKTAIQFGLYRKKGILSDVRSTPGQLFMATITYYEGYTESAIGVSINDAARMIDISSDVIKQMHLPAMSQVRIVHPTRATLGFTGLQPKTAVFEFGLANDLRFRTFEDKLVSALTADGIRYAFHWSKNSGMDPERVCAMYSAAQIASWRMARQRVFGYDADLMRVFDNCHLKRLGLT